MKKNAGHARTAGVLMPVASLPTREGAGTFGKAAYQFVDFLAEAGIGIWQFLPLNPLGFGNSPYQPFSSYAGEALYIGLDLLEEDGLLPKGREAYASDGPRDRVDYEKAKAWKAPFLREAWVRFSERRGGGQDFQRFREQAWVYPYAVFSALKKQNGMICWNEWPEEQRDWILDRRYPLDHLRDEIEYQIFVQYIFQKQYFALKAYANSRNVQIMGDLPFYVGVDSLDVWGGRENFLLDEQCRPSFVAGVPPDYFTPVGQRWGNPIYNWDHIAENQFAFWTERLQYSSRLYDIVRIDHFRAFDTYWKIPASCETAVDGEWVEAPGYALFDEVYREMPDIQIVAEDLGELRPEVLQLRDHYGLIGMNIAQYSLLSPETLEEHQLIYTGTHDNQTVKSWYQDLNRGTKERVRKKLAAYGGRGESIPKKMVRWVYDSPASMAIIPLMDLLGLDDRARLNCPGTVGSPNWEWRLRDWKPLKNRASFIREAVIRSGRASHPDGTGGQEKNEFADDCGTGRGQHRHGIERHQWESLQGLPEYD